MKFRFPLLLLFIFAISHFAQKQTDGFTLSKISRQLIEKQGPLFHEEFLLQPYIYHGKGGQSYVFFSEDGNYVLKCFRFSKMQTLSFLCQMFPCLYFKTKKNKQKHLLQQTLESYFLAFEELSSETGLLEIHVDSSKHLSIPLKLIDKLGILHTIDPNCISFVIQKRAVLVKEKIAQKMQTDDVYGARENIAALFSLVKTRMEKKIEDIDPNVTKNFGFIGEQAIQIDAGGFFKNTAPSSKPIMKSIEDLGHWIQAHYPVLSIEYRNLFQEYFHEPIPSI